MLRPVAAPQTIGRVRHAWSAATKNSLASPTKSLLGRLQAELWFWRSAARAVRAPAKLWGVRRHLLRDRLYPFELRLFGDHLADLLPQRDELFLQLDLHALQPICESPALETKSGFANACARHGLPHVPTILLGLDRKIEGEPALPLFLKPNRANRARGCAVLSRTGSTQYSLQTQQGETIGSCATLLRAHCRDEELVLQPLLQNCSEIAALVGSVPLTIRAVTGWDRQAARLLSALVEIPLDEALPIASRWAIAPIDRTSGRVARFERGILGTCGRHPVTDATLTDWQLVHWPELVDLVERAHRLVAADTAMVGWDVAITPDGPVLIEANHGWAVATHCINSGGFDLSAARRFKLFADRLTAGT